MTLTGFGAGPFGEGAFGEHPWAKQVFFDSLPAIYRLEDPQNSNFLQKYAFAQGQLFDNLREKIRKFRDLRDPIAVRTQYDEVQLLRLGPQRPLRGAIEQRGLDGTVVLVEVGTYAFNSPTSRFSFADIGKELTAIGSNTPFNNRPFIVSSIIDPSTVTTSPPLQPSASPPDVFRWELRTLSPGDFVRVQVQEGEVSVINPGWELTDGFGQFNVLARRQFRTSDQEATTLTDAEGLTGSVNPRGYFVAPPMAFAQGDVGKVLTSTGSDIQANNDRFVVRRVVVPSTPGDPVAVLTSYELLRGFDSNGGVSYSALQDSGTIVPTIQHVQTGLSSPLLVEVTGLAVTVQLQTDGFGLPISTAAAVAAAVNADPIAGFLFRASAEGTGLSAAAPSDAVPVPGRLMQPDVGPLTWALLAHPELDLEGLKVPVGCVSQFGTDLQVIASSPTSARLQAKTATFEVPSLGFQVDNLAVPATPPNGLYTATINGSTGSFTASGSTQADVVAGLIASLNALGQPVFASDHLNLHTSVDITAQAVGQSFTDSVTSPASSLVLTTSTMGATPGDTNKRMLLRGSLLGNDGIFRVLNVLNASTVDIDSPLTVETSPTLFWELRSSTALGDLTQVSTNAPSLITFLAQDFGEQIDRQENEARQRSAVRDVTRWIGKKGVPDGYRIRGLISGFDVSTVQLYRVDQDIALNLIPPTELFEVGNSNPGKFGSDASLLAGTGLRLRLHSPSANFTNSDIGSSIITQNAARLLLNGSFVIETVIDPQTVDFSLAYEPSPPNPPLIPLDNSPDSNNGSISWLVVRYYTGLPDILPVYDEINVDAMQAYVVDGLAGVTGLNLTFTPDHFCWEVHDPVIPSSQTFLALIVTTITSVTQLAQSRWQVTVRTGPGNVGTAKGPFNVATITRSGSLVTVVTSVANTFASGDLVWIDGASDLSFNGPRTITVFDSFTYTYNDPQGDVLSATGGTAASYSLPIGDITQLIVGLGVWRVTDSSGNVFFMETAPAPMAGNIATFEVVTSVMPVPTPVSQLPVTIEYVCPQGNLGCDYCPASVIIADITAGTIASETGVAIQNVLDRFLVRLQEVTPAHVRLVPRISQSLEASLMLNASGFADAFLAAPVVMAGVGSLTATQSLFRTMTASFVGSGSLAVSASTALAALGSLVGVGMLGALDLLTLGMSGSFAGAGALTVTSSETEHGFAVLSGAGSLTAVDDLTASMSATMAGSGSLVATNM